MAQDKALGLLSIARKAGKIELGEEPVAAVAKLGRARLILVASDASDNTARHAAHMIEGSRQLLAAVPYSKEQLGGAMGYSPVALAAFTDTALALAFVRALDPAPQYAALADALARKAERLQKRAGTKKHQKPS